MSGYSLLIGVAVGSIVAGFWLAKAINAAVKLEDDLDEVDRVCKG